MNKTLQRDTTIDMVRTIAIVIMMAANLGSLLNVPHPLWFRYYCSMAAPLFVVLAGMMVGFAVIKSKDTAQFSYFAKRGLFLIFCAALVDAVIWQDVPFIGVDILYLTGLGIPLAYVATRFTTRANFVMVSVIIITTHWLQKLLGYSPEVFSIPLGVLPEFSGELFARIGRMWLIEGWFPLFPWLGYIFFGVALAKLRWTPPEYVDFSRSQAALVGGALTVVGFFLMHQFPTTYFERDNYAEMFYPSTIGFNVLSLGIIVLVFFLAEKTKHQFFWNPWLSLGEASLFVYLSHVAIIEGIEKNWESLTPKQFLIVLATMTVALVAITKLLRALKTSDRNLPLLVRWVIGS